MKISAQKNKFLEIYQKNSKDFGKKIDKSEPNFLFFIEIPLTLPVQQEMGTILTHLKSEFPEINSWKIVEELAITIALPGRMGTHFQGNQINFMESKLAEITAKITKFSVKLSEINCFPQSFFREVLDESASIFKLHETICENIPFSQNPDFQYENFMPHISLNKLNEPVNVSFDRFEKFRKIEDQSMEVFQINFGKINKEKNNEITSKFWYYSNSFSIFRVLYSTSCFIGTFCCC